MNYFRMAMHWNRALRPDLVELAHQYRSLVHGTNMLYEPREDVQQYLSGHTGFTMPMACLLTHVVQDGYLLMDKDLK